MELLEKDDFSYAYEDIKFQVSADASFLIKHLETRIKELEELTENLLKVCTSQGQFLIDLQKKIDYELKVKDIADNYKPWVERNKVTKPGNPFDTKQLDDLFQKVSSNKYEWAKLQTDPEILESLKKSLGLIEKKG